MERLIAGLLEQFECGYLTRRQLIQSLAVAAAAASPASAAAAQSTTIPPATAPSPWNTVWLAHISYQVSDYQKSAAFHRDLMGWRSTADNGTSQCTMRIGDVGQIIIRNRRRTDTVAQPAQPGRPPLTGLIDHVALASRPGTRKTSRRSSNAAACHPGPTWSASKAST